jgi:putative thioredoxin
MYKVITALNHPEEVVAASHHQPVLLYFWASWCAPCRLMGPILERMADKANGRWLLGKVATETEPVLTEACEVNSLPALQLFMHGKMVAEFIDLLPETKLTAWLEGSIAAAIGAPCATGHAGPPPKDVT